MEAMEANLRIGTNFLLSKALLSSRSFAKCLTSLDETSSFKTRCLKSGGKFLADIKLWAPSMLDWSGDII